MDWGVDGNGIGMEAFWWGEGFGGLAVAAMGGAGRGQDRVRDGWRETAFSWL